MAIESLTNMLINMITLYQENALIHIVIYLTEDSYVLLTSLEILDARKISGTNLITILIYTKAYIAHSSCMQPLTLALY